ncbi:MAG TPA: YvcK family protein [Acidobacteria bacterium]|nr:YvcK family protein [Acidobacteriota bacterium]
MLLRRLNVGCFGGGTGLPSLIGGLKHKPWLRVNAIVTVFDSGGSSGVLRDQLGVLPPGDVLRCALALARNETEARRILLTRLSGFEHDKLGGHTGGNLLLSMMEQYSGDFLAAVDGLRTLLDCVGRVWPISVEQATVCAEYEDGSRTRGEVEVDAEQSQGRRVGRVWLEPEVSIHPAAAAAIPTFDAVIIGPGSFYTSLVPIFLPAGVREVVAAVDGPIVLVTNLLTEGRGMKGFTAGAAVSRISEVIGRSVDVVIVNTGHPGEESLARYADEHKEPLLVGDVPDGCEVITGEFWQGAFARHTRRRLAYAVWGVLSQRLLGS